MEPVGTRALLDADFAPSVIAERGLETTTFREFEPTWVDTPAPYRADRLRVLDGAAQVRTLQRTPVLQRFSVEATTPARLELGTYWFPGWELRIDGEESPWTWVDSGGLPRFSLPAGTHAVEARFRGTPARRGTRAISLLALLALAGWLAMARRDERDEIEGGGDRAGPETWIALAIAGAAVAGILVGGDGLPTTSPQGPEAAAMHVQLAGDFVRAGRADLAEREYRAALAVEPTRDGWLGLGMVALEADRLGEAAEAFEAASRLDGASYAAWLDLGIARSRLGQHREALDPYVRALELSPGSVDARHNLGVTWLALGDPGRAVDYLRGAVGAAPRRADSWHQLGRAHEALGQREAARDAFQRAGLLDPADEEARDAAARLGGAQPGTSGNR
jgi:tetratricopeptide (TPR) repeat protein